MASTIKLTPKQRELFEAIKAHPGSILRRHIKMSNTVCFRLLDKGLNPIQNYGVRLVEELVRKEVLQLKGSDAVLKATSSGGNYVKS